MNNKGGLKVRPPSYFDRLFDMEYPEEMEKIKNVRKEIAKNEMEMKLSKTDMNLFEMLQAEEVYLMERLTSLRRDKV